MRYLITILAFLVFVAGCESETFVFRPGVTYGDPYLTAMSRYVYMLDNWNSERQGQPPPPQAPPEVYAGNYPRPQFQGKGVGSSFMQGYANGAAGGAQAGIIRLQSYRNHAYGVALNKYYSSR